MGLEGTAFLLRQADMLVKDGKYEAALKLIRAVRAQDPQNPYAKAYEDRIRALVLTTNPRGSGRSDQRPHKQSGIPPTSSDAESAQNESENPAASRHLRIRNYVRLARAFLAAGRTEEALNELAFASMIEPRNEEVLLLEEEIQQAGGELSTEAPALNNSDQGEVVPTEIPPSEIPQDTEVVELSPVETVSVEQEVVTQPSDVIAVEQEADPVQSVEQNTTDGEMLADAPIQEGVAAIESPVEEVMQLEQPEEILPAANAEGEQLPDETSQAVVESVAPQDEVLEQVTSIEVAGDVTAEVAEPLAEVTDDVLAGLPEPLAEVTEEVQAELPEPPAQATEDAPVEPHPNDRQTVEIDIESRRVGTVRRQSERAAKLLTSGAFDEALAEVALGLVQDPDNAELHALEGKIWRAKDAVSGEQGENRYQRDHLVRLHLLAAEEFRKKNEFTRALDEVAKAYALDPENKEIQQTDARIRQGETRQNNNDGKILKLVYPNSRAAGGSA